MMKHALFAIAALAGCASHQIDGPIDYTTAGGFSGVGDGMSLHVELDGTATATTPSGQRQFTLDADTLAKLHQAIYDAWTSGDGVYEGNCCDLPVDVIAVHMGGGIDRVSADRNGQNVPAPVTELVKLVRSLIVVSAGA